LGGLIVSLIGYESLSLFNSMENGIVDCQMKYRNNPVVGDWGSSRKQEPLKSLEVYPGGGASPSIGRKKVVIRKPTQMQVLSYSRWRKLNRHAKHRGRVRRYVASQRHILRVMSREKGREQVNVHAFVAWCFTFLGLSGHRREKRKKLEENVREGKLVDAALANEEGEKERGTSARRGGGGRNSWVHHQLYKYTVVTEKAREKHCLERRAGSDQNKARGIEKE